MIRPTTYIATEKDNTKIQRNKLLDRYTYFKLFSMQPLLKDTPAHNPTFLQL